MNKEFGQELVLKHSGSWSDQALSMLEWYIQTNNEEFTMDDFRVYAEYMGLNPPHHHNAWGALFNHCAKLNLIRPTGKMWESTRTEAHKRLIRGWKKA